MRLIETPGEITGGQVLLHGEDLLSLPEDLMEDYRGSRLAMIFQEPMTALNPVLTIGYQMDEQIMRHMGLTRAESRERALEMLDLVGIPSPRERYESYPHQLSGGMRQRAMIAMALSCEPEFLIADEPTTALDVTIQGQILELIQRLQERLHMSVQFITHDLGVISEISDEVLVMYAGTACEKAPTEKLMDAPRHPYTVALLQSIPRLGRRVARLPAISGTVPTLHELPPGCPFQNRCPRVLERCRAERPVMTAVAADHELACFNPVDDR
jgi:peptide/nickel transport system ATP-binding protein